MTQEKKTSTRPVRVGLCGRSGAGKGTVCSVFAQYGIPSVDTDAVYRQLTAPVRDKSSLSLCMRELIGEFSECILKDDLSLDRRALADIVFSPNGEDSLTRLNAITHRHILARTDELVRELYENGARAVIIDAPVLFESGYDKSCDIIIAVDAPDDSLVRRIVRRDGISAEAARRRLASQLTREQLRERCDMVIVNDCNMPQLCERVREAAEFILRRIPD